LEHASDEINSTAWSDQQLLAAAGDDRKVRVYDGAQDRGVGQKLLETGWKRGAEVATLW